MKKKVGEEINQYVPIFIKTHNTFIYTSIIHTLPTINVLISLLESLDSFVSYVPYEVKLVGVLQ